MDTEVTFEDAKGHIKVFDGVNRMGTLEFELIDGTMVIQHTYTFKGYENKGVGMALMGAAVEAAKERGMKINPLCSFAKVYFDRHRELESLKN